MGNKERNIYLVDIDNIRRENIKLEIANANILSGLFYLITLMIKKKLSLNDEEVLKTVSMATWLLRRRGMIHKMYSMIHTIYIRLNKEESWQNH